MSFKLEVMTYISATPDSYLGKISNYFHLNNKNNQLKNQVQLP